MGALDYKTRRHRRNRLAAELAATYSPRRHFRLGQDVGWHWQFDNPLTRVGIPYEWVDTAGTTAVTAVGQGIGLLLGREYGGATGPSLLANGATGLTGTATAASYSTTTFAGSVSRAGDASNQSWVTWTGLTTSAVHRIRVANTGATSLDVRNGDVAGTIVASIAAGASSWVHPATTGGSTSITITATANSTTATFTLGQFAVLPGTHLIQATGTAKPTLSARVNLATATEVVANALPWACNNYTIENNSLATGIGKPAFLTKVTALAGSGITTHTHTASATNFRVSFLLASPSTRVGGLALLIRNNTTATNLLSSTMNAAGAIVAGAWTSSEVAPGIFQVAVNVTSGVSVGNTVLVYWGSIGGSTTGDYWYVGGMDIRTADDAAKNIPAYQRVGATASDHDTDGYPHFAEGDGTDNAWASVATVDGSATDKLTVVAAVTKNSDAASGAVLELSNTSSANAGSFAMFAPGSNGSPTYFFRSRGTAGAVDVVSASTFAAPSTGVVVGVGDISGDRTELSVSGVAQTPNTADQGSGNYRNDTLYVLSRAGTSLRFNGRFYGSTGRFGSMSDSERNNLTRWWQKRIGTA